MAERRRRSIIIVITLLLLAPGCGPRGEDTGDTSGRGDTTSPLEMPYYGECSRDIAFDRLDDGSVDYTKVWTYDADEHLVYYQLDDVEGSYDERHYTYDSTGCYVGYERYAIESDGDIEQTTADMSCDEHGNVAHESMVTVYGDPEDPDDVWTLTYAYTNNYEGELIVQREVEVWFDIRSYGTYDWVYTELNEYEGEWMVLRETWLDGEQTENETWDWDADGNLLRYEALVLDDGGDYLEEHSYDEHGRELTERQVSESDDLLRSYSNVWDDSAYRILEITLDDREDGSPDAVWTRDCQGEWPWSCDVAYEVEADEAGTHVDGVIDHSYTDTWSCP